MSPAASGVGGGATHEYQFGAALPLGAVRAGTNLLVEGSGVDGTGTVLDRLLTSGRTPGEAAVLVSTEGPAATTARHLKGATNVGLVCCGAGSDEDVDDEFVAASVGTPGDLTGIGIQFSKVADAIDGGGPLRVGVDSVSTLLMYAEDPRSVFRFLHAFTGRITAMDALGLFVVDPDAHDERTLAMVRGSFDGRIEVRTGEQGSELRVSGLGGQQSGWEPFRLED